MITLQITPIYIICTVQEKKQLDWNSEHGTSHTKLYQVAITIIVFKNCSLRITYVLELKLCCADGRAGTLDIKQLSHIQPTAIVGIPLIIVILSKSIILYSEKYVGLTSKSFALLLLTEGLFDFLKMGQPRTPW